MSDDPYTSGRQASFKRAIFRDTGGATLAVLVMAAAFWLIGMTGDDGETDLADGASQDSDTSPDADSNDPDPDTPAAGDDGDDASNPDPENAPAEDDPEPEPGTEPDSEPAAPEGDDGSADQDQSPSDEDASEPEALDPAGISVQVLDGYREDGGAAADEIAGLLEAAGYEVVARNPAIAYELTTVLWTEGHEAAGRQVAEQIGAAESRVQPGNLSEEVDVHVVVGADRG